LSIIGHIQRAGQTHKIGIIRYRVWRKLSMCV